jgi:hypothetical protein
MGRINGINAILFGGLMGRLMRLMGTLPYFGYVRMRPKLLTAVRHS